jgi:hypothetical protein
VVKKLSLVFILSCSLVFAHAQNDSTGFFVPAKTLNKKRFNGLMIGAGSLYAVSMAGLYVAWYKDYPLTGFHFFNDNAEWMQMDKMGHLTASYHIGVYCSDMFRWSGLERKKAIWLGGSMGSIFLTTIEIFDGFSAEYGASWGDLIANTGGSLLAIGQELAWDEQRIILRYGFMNSPGWQYRPNLLGSTVPERLLKDYNSYTMWLSFNIHSFLPETSRFPRWLNVAFGYGANGMLGAHSNPVEYNGAVLPHYERYRQYYFSLDVQLSKIRTRSKALKLIFSAFDVVKFPFPALEYNRVHGFGVHPFNKH